MDSQALLCPSCSREYPPSERFCETCAMPLIHAVGAEEAATATPRQRRARKIKPEYAEGGLVKVARAENLVQGEFLAGLLLEEGIPSMLRSSIAGYAPLTGGRDVLVPESGAEAAREALSWQRGS